MPLHFKAKMYILLYEKMSIYLCQKMYKQSYLLHVAARGHVNRRTSEERGNLFLLSSEKEEKAKGLNYGRGPQAQRSGRDEPKAKFFWRGSRSGWGKKGDD